MRGSPRLSVAWLREVLQRSGVAAVYLVLDQFEEYFLHHPNDRREDELTGALGHILSNRDLQVNILLSIREDGTVNFVVCVAGMIEGLLLGWGVW